MFVMKSTKRECCTDLKSVPRWPPFQAVLSTKAPWWWSGPRGPGRPAACVGSSVLVSSHCWVELLSGVMTALTVPTWCPLSSWLRILSLTESLVGLSCPVTEDWWLGINNVRRQTCSYCRVSAIDWNGPSKGELKIKVWLHNTLIVQ